MTFDIHQEIFDEDGETLEQAEEYQAQLIELFEESPEAQELWDDGMDGGWISMMLDFGHNYIGVTVPQMSATDMHEILFDLIPRKVSAPADEAPEIIREFQAFWRFMQREFHLENAAACLSVLNDQATNRLKKAMSNPANFGMAKSLFMTGQQRGFDMHTEEGINAWMNTYNAELAAGTGTPLPLRRGSSLSHEELASRIKIIGAPDQSDEELAPSTPISSSPSQSPLGLASRHSSRSSSYNKQKSKMAKASRKKNRKKK